MDGLEADFGPEDAACVAVADARGAVGTAVVGLGAVGAGRRRRRRLDPDRNLGGPVGSVRFCAEVARTIAMRVESGESLRGVCADADMPHRATVTAWMKRAPAFGRAIRRAREAAGWRYDVGRPPKWDAAAGREVCRRVAEGEALSKVCEDPDLPSLGVVYRWRAEDAEFAAQMRLAREVAAERFCDLGWDIACEITPETAYATHVKLTQLRWMAATLSPKRFGRVKPVTGEAEAEILAETAEPKEVVFRVRHYERVVGEDGRAYVREAEELPEGMACVKAPDWREQRARREAAEGD